ncbi:ribonuclease H-like domain-containing protein, partial [Haematococcus lacustris]
MNIANPMLGTPDRDTPPLMSPCVPLAGWQLNHLTFPASQHNERRYIVAPRYDVNALSAVAAMTALLPPGPYFCIDVECVATSTHHNGRAVAQISLVDQAERVILNLYVKPEQPVVSYLQPLTGLNKRLLDEYGMRLQDAVATVRAHLPRNAILVGQSISKDVEWLGLKEGVDFAELRDLAGMFRVHNPRYKSWTVFSLDAVAKVLLNWQAPEGGGDHNAVQDAVKSIRVFNHYIRLTAQPGALEAAQAALLAAPPMVPFSRRHATFEGVCMGNRKQCSCGAPFFS